MKTEVANILFQGIADNSVILADSHVKFADSTTILADFSSKIADTELFQVKQHKLVLKWRVDNKNGNRKDQSP